MFSFIHSNSLLIVQSSNLLKQYLSQCVGSVGSRAHVCREWYHLHNCQCHVYIPLKTLYIHVEQQRPQYWILGMTKYYFSVITVSFIYLSSMSSFRKVAKDKIRWFRVKSISCMFSNKEVVFQRKAGDESVKRAQQNHPVSKISLHFSVITSRQCWVVEPWEKLHGYSQISNRRPLTLVIFQKIFHPGHSYSTPPVY